MSLWSERCFIVASWQSQHLPVKNTKWKNKALGFVPDQIQLRSNPPLWSDFSVRIDLWSDPLQTMVQIFQTKITSDQTISRPSSRLYCVSNFEKITTSLISSDFSLVQVTGKWWRFFVVFRYRHYACLENYW